MIRAAFAALVLAASAALAVPHDTGKHGTSRDVTPPAPGRPVPVARGADPAEGFRKEQAHVQKLLDRARDRAAHARNPKEKKALERRVRLLEHRLARTFRRFSQQQAGPHGPVAAPAGQAPSGK